MCVCVCVCVCVGGGGGGGGGMKGSDDIGHCYKTVVLCAGKCCFSAKH